METLGETIKTLRKENHLPLRRIAAHLDIDQALLSKYEHDTRMPKREHLMQLARFYKIDDKPLLIKWLAAKILAELNGDEHALDAIQMAKTYIKGRQVQINIGTNKEQDNQITTDATIGSFIFSADKLPSYTELAQYIFSTATGKKYDETVDDNHTGYIGESDTNEVYLFYKPNRDWLKNNAVTLNMIKNLPPYKGKIRLIFASLKYVNDESCRQHYVEFGKIPY